MVTHPRGALGSREGNGRKGTRRIPVIAGIGFDLPIAIDLAQQLARAGADAILRLPPYYPNADEEGLANYYEDRVAPTLLGLLLSSRTNPIDTQIHEVRKPFSAFGVGNLLECFMRSNSHRVILRSHRVKDLPPRG